jgi:hypothetical protein
MNMNDIYTSKYLKASDLNGTAHVVTISRFSIEDLGDPAKPERKPVLYFAGQDKGLVLNKTNAMSISARFGPEMDRWVGGQLELFAMMVQKPNGPVDGIRLRPLQMAPQVVPGPTPAPEAASAAQPKF